MLKTNWWISQLLGNYIYIQSGKELFRVNHNTLINKILIHYNIDNDDNNDNSNNNDQFDNNNNNNNDRTITIKTITIIIDMKSFYTDICYCQTVRHRDPRLH